MDGDLGTAVRRLRATFAGYPVRPVLQGCPHCRGTVVMADEDLFDLSIRLGNTVGTYADMKSHPRYGYPDLLTRTCTSTAGVGGAWRPGTGWVASAVLGPALGNAARGVGRPVPAGRSPSRPPLPAWQMRKASLPARQCGWRPCPRGNANGVPAAARQPDGQAGAIDHTGRVQVRATVPDAVDVGLRDVTRKLRLSDGRWDLDQCIQKSSGSASTSIADRSRRSAMGSSAIDAASPASAIRRMTPACRRPRCGTTAANTRRSPS